FATDLSSTLDVRLRRNRIMHSEISRPTKRVLAMAAYVWLVSAPLWGQGPAVKPPTVKHTPAEAPGVSSNTSNTKGAAALTPEDISTFLDGFMPQQLEQADIAGATVAIVKDGQLLFSRGYGYSD